MLIVTEGKKLMTMTKREGVRPKYKPSFEGEIATVIEVTQKIKHNYNPLGTNEITHHKRQRFFVAKENDGLSWFEIEEFK